MGRGYRGMRLISSTATTNLSSDTNDKFIGVTVINYLKKHMRKYSFIDENTLSVICWILGNDRSNIGKNIIKLAEKESSELEHDDADDMINIIIKKDFFDNKDDYKDYADTIVKYAMEMPKRVQTQIEKNIIQLLDKRLTCYFTKRQSELEKRLKALKKTFDLSDNEVQYSLLIFILWEYDVVGKWLEEYLEIGSYVGRKYLTNLLGINLKELQKIESGTLKHIGVLDESKNVLLDWLQNPSSKSITQKYYRKMPKTNVTLDQHFFDDKEIAHLKSLLKTKPTASNHILFYGPPGTGKSTLAYRLVQELGVKGYEIIRGDENNSSTSRRTSILSCIALTNTKEGSVILVDEAENILETENAWSLRGEIRDKGWLNDLLEQPGLRIIWIVNTKSCINNSVATRFSYSLYFKTFSLEQRTKLVEDIIVKNGIKRFFKPCDIQSIANRYTVSARDFDMTIKIAKKSYNRKKDIIEGIHIGLKAKHQLYGLGDNKIEKVTTNNEYTLAGINSSRDLGNIIRMLEKYTALNRDQTLPGLNMLFFGPSGSGKSAFARHLANHLDKKLVVKRGSDLLHSYVGDSEKAIRRTFEEAQATESILLIDEIDSVLRRRENALQNYEISFTNEFLTSMEDFQGILVATTNGFSRIDPAAVGRFRERIEFKYLTAQGNLIFYQNYLSPLLEEPLPELLTPALKSIQCLTPRDFSNIRNHFILYEKDEFDHDKLINALKQAVADKEKNNNNKVIGF